MEYEKFIRGKRSRLHPMGFQGAEINSKLFPWQKAVTEWAVKMGRAALFEDCGLGKTFQQIEWARVMSEKTRKPVLILAPLAVSTQTIREGKKLGVEIARAKRQQDASTGIIITNYERLNAFDCNYFGAIVLDESSILKSFSGVYRQEITDFASRIPYRLACTATPAPNDFMEIGTHSEFLSVMRRVEMLSTYFVHDASDTQAWRLKGHAEEVFWSWMAQWCVAIRKPSDIGFDDGSYVLPPLNHHEITVESKPLDGFLFPTKAQSLLERRQARRSSLEERVKKCAEIVNSNDEQWLVWCDLNDESEALKKACNGAVEVRGSDSPEEKESAMMGFVDGSIRVLVSKSSICGFGMNFQNCHNMAFVGLSDSFEATYQAIRRCWRFGQKKPVECYTIVSEAEGAVVENIKRKENQFHQMFDELVKHISVYEFKDQKSVGTYQAKKKIKIPTWLKGE